MNIDRSVFSDPSAYFTPRDSLDQLNRLRGAVFPATTTSPKPDALLLVGGVDSRDDPWNIALIQHLFRGSTRCDSSSQQILWDLVVLISESSSEVYTSPQGLPLVQVMTAAWPNNRIHVANNKVWDDENELEDHKIMTLRLMVANKTSVAMLVHPQDAQQKGGMKQGEEVVKTIEKWPLIQSFAVDPAGRRPFFSLAKKVVDVTDAVARQFLPADTATTAVPLIASQIGLMMESSSPSSTSSLNHTRKSVALSSVTTLKGQWEAFLIHAGQVLKNGANASKINESVEPLAMYRTFISQQQGGSGSPTSSSGVSTTINGSGQTFSVKFVDPCLGNLTVARTYATTALYDQATAAILSGMIETLTSGGDPGSQKADPRKELSSSKSTLKCMSQEVGQELIYLELSSPDGAVTYGDTFLVLNNSEDEGGQWFNLTQSIPPLVASETGILNLKQAADFGKFVEVQMDVPPSQRDVTAPVAGGKVSNSSLGICADIGRLEDVCNASDGVQCYIWPTSSSPPLAIPQAKCCVFSEGFALQQHNLGVLGPFPLFRNDDKGKDFKLEKVCNPNDTTQPIIFRFASTTNTDLKVDFAFQANSSARRDLVSMWLPQWKGVEIFASLIRSEATLVTEIATRSRLFYLDGNSSSKARDKPGSSSSGKASIRARMQAADDALIFYHGEDLLDTMNRTVLRTSPIKPPTASRTVYTVLFSGPIGGQKHKLLDGVKRAMESEAAALRGAKTGSSLGVGCILPTPFDEKISDLSQDYVQSIRNLGHELATKNDKSVLFLYCPTFVPLPRLYHTVQEIGALEAAAARWVVQKSIIVISPDTFYGNTLKDAEKGSLILGKTSSEDPVDHLTVANFARQCIVPGYYDLLVIHQPASNRARQTNSGGSIDPQLLAAVEGDIADCHRGTAGSAPGGDPRKSRPPIVYSFQDALQTVVTELNQLVVSANGGTDPARFSLSFQEQAAFERSLVDRSLWLDAARGFQPYRHVVVSFRKMFITEPALNEFLGFASSSRPAMETSHPWYSVVFTKGLLTLGGKRVEITCTSGMPSLNKYQEKRLDTATSSSSSRHGQEFHLFLDTAKLKENMWARRCENEKDMLRALQLVIEGELSSDSSVLDTLVASASSSSSTTTCGGIAAQDINSESLTQADLLKIQGLAQEQSIPLPEGWKVGPDGQRYVRVGESEDVSSELRPDIYELATAYIAELLGDTTKPFSSRGPEAQKVIEPEPPVVEDEDEDNVE